VLLLYSSQSLQLDHCGACLFAGFNPGALTATRCKYRRKLYVEEKEVTVTVTVTVIVTVTVTVTVTLCVQISELKAFID